MLHRLHHQLRNGTVDSAQEAFNTNEGYTFGWGTTVGNGVEGWAPGALFVHTDGAGNNLTSINTGSKTTASWAGVSGTALAAGEIWVSPNGSDSDVGSRAAPYLTVTAALAAVTNGRKQIFLMPGEYAEATGLSWPTISNVQLFGMGNRWQTVISASAGDQVLDMAPGAQSGTWQATIQNIQFDHDTGGQDGLKITHTSVGKKMNVYLGAVSFAGDSSDLGILVVHGGSGNAVRIYWDGGNGSCDSAIDLDSEDGGDRFYVENVMFEANIDAGAANTTQTIRLFNCQILHEGFTGGGASGVVVLGGCRSKTGTTYAIADDTDVTANASLTGPTTFP